MPEHQIRTDRLDDSLKKLDKALEDDDEFFINEPQTVKYDLFDTEPLMEPTKKKDFIIEDKGDDLGDFEIESEGHLEGFGKADQKSAEIDFEDMDMDL